jgi:GNAT superfamily N-acetyltransferase
MINTNAPPSPFPHQLIQECVFRPAQCQERWQLQKLIWQFELEEVLALEARVISYKLLILVGISLILIAQMYLYQLSPTLVRLILSLSIIYNGFLVLIAINTLFKIVHNIFLGAVNSWSRFWVIEYNQELIGCASLYFYHEHSSIGYLYIRPEQRNQGLGSSLLKILISQSPHPVSLVCKPKLMSFYRRHGFSPVSWHKLSSIFKIMYRIFQPHPKLIGYPLVIMEHQNAA